MIFDPNNRHILVVTGEHEVCLDYAKQLCRNLDYVESDTLSKSQSILGQEFDAVIFNRNSDFDANAFGAVSGTIRGGGYLILLRPQGLKTNSLFLSRFDHILANNTLATFLDPLSSNDKDLVLKYPPKKQFKTEFANDEQKKAVAAIIKVATRHRRRPLILVADRGRGKSAALGIAATKLTEQGIRNIIICAPSKQIASSVLKHTDGNTLQFFSPDELLQQRPIADLVLIDEAAAIPLSLLSAFVKHYARIVFSSTQHGYEGSGRGFAINFRKTLNDVVPDWKETFLSAPIRWNKNDTIETFTFNALLLDAEAADSKIVKNTKLTDCHFSTINKKELLTNNQMLRELFGLLVSAHYQTKPSDLQQLLDDDNVTIYYLAINKSVIAVALVIQEGRLEKTLLNDIFTGKRRHKGHLVAQALSSTIGIKNAPALHGERISRIAVHPNLQNQGFGTSLLKKIIDQSSTDYLSTSFGATEPLINFWKKSCFSCVHLGIKRDASSGSHSTTMLYPKTNEGRKVNEQATDYFSKSFPHLLADVFSNLESDIVFTLLSKPQTNSFNDQELAILHAFATGSRGYENSLHLIHSLVLDSITSFKTLNNEEKQLLITKVLQRKSWTKLNKNTELQLTGKKEALNKLRHVTNKLLSTY